MSLADGIRGDDVTDRLRIPMGIQIRFEIDLTLSATNEASLCDEISRNRGTQKCDCQRRNDGDYVSAEGRVHTAVHCRIRQSHEHRPGKDYPSGVLPYVHA